MNFQKVLPPGWFLFSIILMIGFHLELPVRQIFFPPISYVGIGLILIGIVIILSCAYLFRQKNTTIKPFQESTNLVTEGLFAFSRNPIYLGMIITLIGIWIVLGSLTPLILIFAFAWLIQEMFIKQEEQMLEDKFGDEYREYKATVRRWV